MIFTNRLRELGLTKREFAGRVGVRPETVARWREAPPRWVMLLLDCWEGTPQLMRESLDDDFVGPAH